MRSSQQQVPKGREPPRQGDLWTEQIRIRGYAGSAAERPVMPVNIGNAPDPIPESVLPRNLPSVQIGRGVGVEMQVGVASKHFHRIFLLLRLSTECCEATQCKYQQHFSQHKNPLLLKDGIPRNHRATAGGSAGAGEGRDTIFELVNNGPKGPERLGEELYTRKSRGQTGRFLTFFCSMIEESRVTSRLSPCSLEAQKLVSWGRQAALCYCPIPKSDP